MIFKDLLKISIYIIAEKLFVDCISQIPERIYYASSLAEDWITNVLLYLCLNLLIAFLLFRFSNDLIDKLFLKKNNYLDTTNSSVVRIAIIICSYYIAITTGFSLITNIFSVNLFYANIFSKIISMIISLVLILFSNTIAEKLLKNE